MRPSQLFKRINIESRGITDGHAPELPYPYLWAGRRYAYLFHNDCTVRPAERFARLWNGEVYSKVRHERNSFPKESIEASSNANLNLN